MGVNLIDLPDSSESDSNYREFIKRRDLNYNTLPQICDDNITTSTKLYPYGNKTAPLRPEHTSLVYFSYPPGAPGQSMYYKLPDRPRVPGGPIVVTDKQGNIVVTTTALPEEEEEESDEDDLDRQRTLQEHPTTAVYIELDTKDKSVNIKRKIREVVAKTLHETAVKIKPLKNLKVHYYQNSYTFGMLFSAVKKAKAVLNEQFTSVVNHFHTRNSLELLKMYEQLTISNRKNTALVRSLVLNVQETGY